MAKRKRLEPFFAAEMPEASAAASKIAPPPFGPPIARVAQDAAREAAFDEVSSQLAQARAEGRLLQKIPLSQIDLDHLLRDRLGIDEDEMAPLVESLRARGQQTAVEVVALGDQRFGLISGWRRVVALRRLYQETADARFATVLAVLRHPRDAGEAYVAMVEENEIRLGLSHYERARIVARAVAEGVFPDRQTALRKLFAAGSRARRSKIGSFVTVVDALDDIVRFPTRMGERLGLALALKLAASPEFGPALRQALTKAAPADAEAEQMVLEAAVRAAQSSADHLGRAAKGGPDRPAPPRVGAQSAAEVAPGIRLDVTGGALTPVLTLSGTGVDQAFKARLIDWLQEQR